MWFKRQLIIVFSQMRLLRAKQVRRQKLKFNFELNVTQHVALLHALGAFSTPRRYFFRVFLQR